MGRQKFETDTVVKAASEIFWQNGFNGTSMQQLVNATGLKPGSLYLAFGNKEGLFNATLDNYSKASLQLIDETFAREQNSQKALISFFEHIIAASQAKDYKCCFLLNSTLELSHQNPQLHATVTAHLQKIENRFIELLCQDHERADAHGKAKSVMMALLGLRAYSYISREPGEIKQTVRQLLPWLPWPKH